MYIRLKLINFSWFSFLVCFALSVNLWAQVDSTDSNFGGIIYLDSLVVSATRSGFDVGDFIHMVKSDSSFFKAFLNIRFLNYESNNKISFFNKKGENIAQMENKVQQYADDDCRTMKIISEKVTGNYYKRSQKKRFYTAKMYQMIFFEEGRFCKNNNGSQTNKSVLEKHVDNLKTLIFQPGTKVDVPIVGKKTRIFSEELLPYYDYSISSKKYNSEIDCYLFSTKVKKEYQHRKEGKTIIKTLETYFDKSTFSVVARNYHLYYKGAFVDFDVAINIELTKLGDQYVPVFLHFEGFWNLPMKAAERSWFETRFYNFH